MNVKASGKKTTKRVVYYVLCAVTVSFVIGFVLLNASGGAKAPAGSGTEMALSQAMTLSGTQTSGGTQTGLRVRTTFTIHQNKYDDFATDLHFKVWQKEDNIDINGWEIEISHFTNSTSQRGSQPDPYHKEDNGQHAVDVTADGAVIPYCTKVTVHVTLWLTNYNTIRKADVNWTKGSLIKKATVDTGWEVDYPVEDPGNPGIFNHQLRITNDDRVDTCTITGVSYVVTMDYYDDLTQINFPSPQIPDFFLAPGQSHSINIITSEPFIGGHVYFKYDVVDYFVREATSLRILGADHLITTAPSQ